MATKRTALVRVATISTAVAAGVASAWAVIVLVGSELASNTDTGITPIAWYLIFLAALLLAHWTFSVEVRERKQRTPQRKDLFGQLRMLEEFSQALETHLEAVKTRVEAVKAESEALKLEHMREALKLEHPEAQLAELEQRVRAAAERQRAKLDDIARESVELEGQVGQKLRTLAEIERALEREREKLVPPGSDAERLALLHHLEQLRQTLREFPQEIRRTKKRNQSGS